MKIHKWMEGHDMILVIGGAGYIGSHMVRELVQQSYEVVVLDDLSTGHRDSVDGRAVFEKGSFGDPSDLDRVFSRYSIDAVLHAAGSNPGEYTVGDANQYYMDAVGHTVTLLRKMAEYHITNLVYSSTTISYSPSIERRQAIAPYIRSQYVIGKLLEELQHMLPLQYSIIRYGNVAGADESGDMGEDHELEMHVIPRILKYLVQPKQKVLMLDADSTYSGEYVHVRDVVNAHILCLDGLLAGRHVSRMYELGADRLVFIEDIVAMCERITGLRAHVLHADSAERPLTSYRTIYKELGWEPMYSLEDMIQSAWRWHSRHPDGYGKRDVLGLGVEKD
jgi:UDP-glucose 4-epimerase